MRYQQLPSDDLVERVLAGKQSGEGLDNVAAAMVTLRHMHADRGFRMGAELSELLVSGLANEKGDLSATAASNAHGPASQESGLPNWTQRRKRMLHVLLGTLAGKVAAATVAAATVVGGLGAADALPDAVQGAVADAAEVVHINLPSPHDDDESTVVDDADGDDPTEVHDADDDAGEADDDAVADDASDDADETDADESDESDESDDAEDSDDDADESDDDDADEVRTGPSSPATTPTSVTARSSDHDEEEADHSDERSGSSSSASSGSGSGTDHDTEDDQESEPADD